MYGHERSLVKNLAGKPFALIGVNSDEDVGIPQRLAKEGTVTWRSFWNGEQGTRGPIADAYQPEGWPTIVLLDAKGVVRYINPNRVSRDFDENMAALDDAIKTLLEEMGEEFPTEAIKADSKTESAKRAAPAPPGNNPDPRANMSPEERKAAAIKRHRERQKRWKEQEEAMDKEAAEKAAKDGDSEDKDS